MIAPRYLFLILGAASCSDSHRTEHREYWDAQKTQIAERGGWIWKEHLSGETRKLQHGRWETWHRNGQLKSQANFREGKFVGLARFWHENGQLAQSMTHDDSGRADGVVEWWDQAGTLLKSSKFDHGTGNSFYFYPGGNLKAVTPFAAGAAEGKATYYKEDGSIEKQRIFERGQEVKEIGGK